MNWPYIAGFFDGEGCIRVDIFQLTITQSVAKGGDRIFKEMQEFFLVHGIRSSIYRNLRVKSPVVVLRISERKSAIHFLNMTLPYLRVKRTPAQDILRYRKLF